MNMVADCVSDGDCGAVSGGGLEGKAAVVRAANKLLVRISAGISATANCMFCCAPDRNPVAAEGGVRMTKIGDASGVRVASGVAPTSVVGPLNAKHRIESRQVLHSLCGQRSNTRAKLLEAAWTSVVRRQKSGRSIAVVHLPQIRRARHDVVHADHRGLHQDRVSRAASRRFAASPA